MPKLLPLIVVVSIFFVDVLLPCRLSADYYKYTDTKGVVNITNKLESVPARYRSTMKVVREAPKKETPAAAPAQEPVPQTTAAEPALASQAAPESETRSSFARLSARFVWFKPLAYVVGIVALSLVVFKVTSLLSSPLLSKVILISFFLGVMVFLYKSYVEHVVQSSKKIKDTAVTIIKNSSQREETVLPADVPPVQK